MMTAGYGFLLLAIGMTVTFVFFVLWVKAMEYEAKELADDIKSSLDLKTKLLKKQI